MKATKKSQKLLLFHRSRGRFRILGGGGARFRILGAKGGGQIPSRHIT